MVAASFSVETVWKLKTEKENFEISFFFFMQHSDKITKSAFTKCILISFPRYTLIFLTHHILDFYAKDNLASE